MKKRILISAVIVLMHAPQIGSGANGISVIRNCDSLQNIIVNKSEMKTRDLVILVKYAQGAVVFDSFYGMLKFFKPPERKIFLSQIVELIGHFALNDSVAYLAIKKSGLSNTCSACLILMEGIKESQLKKIINLPEAELESSFRLLLTLFSLGYQDGFQRNKNAPDKFWYWDYSEVKNALKLVQLDSDQYVQLDEILRP